MEDTILNNWRALQAVLDRNGKLTVNDRIALNRFQGRYKLARNFKGIVVEGYKERTLLSYNLGFQLFLAYTALERLCKVTKQRHTTVEIFDSPLAEKLRTVYAPQHNSVRNFLAKTNLAQSFEEFMTKKTDNVRIMATALRTLVFAGHFSFSGSGALTPMNIEALQELSNALLNACIESFGKWVEEQKTGLHADDDDSGDDLDGGEDIPLEDEPPTKAPASTTPLATTPAPTTPETTTPAASAEPRRRKFFGF